MLPVTFGLILDIPASYSTDTSALRIMVALEEKGLTYVHTNTLFFVP